MAAADAEVEQRDEVIAAKERQATELHKRCRETKEELKATRDKGDEASRSAKTSERQEGKMARELKKTQAQVEQLESKCEMLREDVVVAEKVKVEAEEAATHRAEVLKKEIAKLKITAERHESQQYEQVESYKAEKVSCELVS